MLLDSLKDFSWYNEPADVSFGEDGMTVETEPETDFWQSLHHNIHKDNGHFFFTRKNGDFTLTLKWRFADIVSSDQCGIMLRIDSLNWIKTGLLTTDLRHPQLGSVVTLNGISDWAIYPLAELPQNLWLRLQRRGKDFLLFASVDGEDFFLLRMCGLPHLGDEAKVGAYACSPQKHSFVCTLAGIE